MPKRVEVKVSKLEGSPLAERGRFAQAHEYVPPEEELLRRRGRLFVVLDIKADPAFDAALAGKLVWDSLSEEYFAESDDPPLKALERAVLSAKNRLTNLTHSSDVLGGGVAVDLNLAAAVVWEGSPGSAGEGGVLYLIRQGKPSIFLRRAGQVRKPLEGEEPSSNASLLVEDEDTVFLGSRDFGKNFTAATLPDVSFFKKEFASGRQVPGMAAAIIGLKVIEEKSVSQPSDSSKEERAPFVPARKISLPSPSGALGRLSKIGSRLKRRDGEKSPIPSGAAKDAWSSAVSAGADLGTRTAAKAKEVGGRLGRSIEEKIGRRILRGREIYLDKRGPRFGLPKVIAALVVIFLLSTTFTLWRQRQRVRAEEFARLLDSVEGSLDEAEDLIGLSATRAKELWQEAEGSLGEAAKIDSDDDRLFSLYQRLETVFNLIEKINPVTSDHLFYDLTLQSDWSQALSIIGREDTVYVSDGGSGATLAIRKVSDVDLPQVEEATANAVKSARRLGREGDFLYLLTDDNFYRTHLFTKSSDSPLSFDSLAAAATFDSYLTNLYMLVPSENQIFKFLNLGTEYSRALTWLKEPAVLEGAVDMAIDGAIWVINQDGTVMKFLAGKRETFAVTGLTTGISQPKALYTRPAFSRLYVAEGNRVVVINKDGQFERQFKGDVLTNLVDLWVSDDEITLYILTASKIFKVGL